MKLSEIKPNPNNPRLIKDEKFLKLVKSIKEFPKMMELRPMVWDANNIVLGGNMRLKALAELGYKEIPETWVKRAENLTEEEIKRFIIVDNVGYGEHDWEMLANEWDLDELQDWGLDIPDFVANKEVEEDNFDAEPPKNPITVLGDVYELNQHRVICGDSTQVDTFEKLFAGRMADLVVTDPPYNVALGMESPSEAKARNRRTDGKVIKNDKMSNDAFYQFLYDFYTALGAYTKAGGAWYVWHADSEVINFRKAMADAGIMPKQGLIWRKSSLVMGRQDYQWQHEPCLYGWKEGAAHGWYSDRKQSTILEFEKPSRNAEHPTMKPIPLFGYQIKNSSKEGDIVADAFGGSGTTIMACDQVNRLGYLAEFDPAYCDVIVARFIKYKQSSATGFTIKRNGVLLTEEQITAYLEQIEPKTDEKHTKNA